MTTPRQRYRITGQYVTVSTQTIDGPMIIGLHQGAFLPNDAPQATVDHLLSVRMIAPFGDPPAAEVEPETVVVSHTAPAEVESEPVGDIAEQRAMAAAKLPADGSAPTRRHGQQVWAEYAVRKGYDRATAEAASKDELCELFAAS